MDVTIRAAEPRDAAEIAAVHVDAWRSTYGGILEPDYVESVSVSRRAAQWERALSDASPQDVFVAQRDARIVGFASCGPTAHRLAGYDAELYTLYLLRKEQRAGLGARLLAAVAARLLQRGYRAMLVWVLHKNTNAIRFYERYGAEFLKTERNPVDDHADAVYGFNDLRALERLLAKPS